jgi:hypothetical protein
MIQDGDDNCEQVVEQRAAEGGCASWRSPGLCGLRTGAPVWQLVGPWVGQPPLPNGFVSIRAPELS